MAAAGRNPSRSSTGSKETKALAEDGERRYEDGRASGLAQLRRARWAAQHRGGQRRLRSRWVMEPHAW